MHLIFAHRLKQHVPFAMARRPLVIVIDSLMLMIFSEQVKTNAINTFCMSFIANLSSMSTISLTKWQNTFYADHGGLGKLL